MATNMAGNAKKSRHSKKKVHFEAPPSWSGLGKNLFASNRKKTSNRPYVIERDVVKLTQSRRVSELLNSEEFVSKVENILQKQVTSSFRSNFGGLKDGPPPPPPPPPVPPALSVSAAPYHTHTTTMVRPINDLRGTLAKRYSKTEQELRCKLASVYRLVDYFGWSQLVYNHITVRVDGSNNHFLLNPFGLLYSEVTASSLVKVDLDGEVIDAGSTRLGVSRAGYTLHSAIHAVRPAVSCIIHVHTSAGAAVSTMSCGLLPISQEALILGPIAYHDYQGIVVDEEEKNVIARDLGKASKVLILRNHGIVALGDTAEEAFHYLYTTMKACEIQVSAMSAGLTGLIQVPQSVWSQVSRVVSKGGGGVSKHSLWGVGDLEFEALMRMLDSQGYQTGYKYRGNHLLRPRQGRLSPRSSREAGPRSSREAGPRSSREAGPRSSREADHRSSREAGPRSSREADHRSSREAGPRSSREADHRSKHPKGKQRELEKEDATNDSESREYSKDAWDFLGTDLAKKTVEKGKKDPWEFVSTTQTGKVSGEIPILRHLELTNGRLPDNAFERTVKTAASVAQSTSQAAQTVASKSDQLEPKEEATPSDSTKHTHCGSAPFNRDTSPTDGPSPINKVRHTAHVVAQSTTEAVNELHKHDKPPTATQVVLNGQMEDNDELIQVSSTSSLKTKITTWMEDSEVQSMHKAFNKMKTTAEQVAESTTSAVEKLTEALTSPIDEIV